MKVTAQDLTTVEGCAGVEQAVRGFGVYADVLVNNAGVMWGGFFQDADPAVMRRMVDLDVRAVEWLGHECLVFGTVGGAPVVVRQTGMSTLRAGDSGRLAVDPADVHVFDPETTLRLT